MAEKSLEEKFYDAEVYNAWQFVENTAKTIHTAEYCKNTVLSLLDKIYEEHNEWQTNLFNQLNDKEKPKRITVTSDDLPKHKIKISDIETDIPFLLNKLIKDFFQYSRNAFDSISQLANAACLASEAIDISKVDFGKMLSVFSKERYSSAFPNIKEWYTTINTDDRFRYLDDFCNRTKHTCDIYLKVSVSLFGGVNTNEINPFVQKGKQQSGQDIKEYLNEVYNFVENSFTDFVELIERAIESKTFVSYRVHKLKVYQQKMSDDDTGNFAVIYIDEIDLITTMPDKIEFLLVSKTEDGTIYSKNCPFNTIYVRSKDNEHTYVGKYVTEDICGDDTLLRYRSYNKFIADPDKLPLLFEIVKEWREDKKYYHISPFFDLDTIVDKNDTNFIARTQLPF